MQAWASRPLHGVYAAIFIDAIYVKVRDGQVGNQPFYAAIGVDLNGRRDVLGLWAGKGGGKSAKFWMSHRGLAKDPLYRARRTLHTGDDFLTDRQRERLMVLFATEEHVQVEASWGIYQRMIAAYRDPTGPKPAQR